MQLSQITTQPPVVSRYGNVTFLLWRGTDFGVVLNGDGRPGKFTGAFSQEEVADAIAPYAPLRAQAPFSPIESVRA